MPKRSKSLPQAIDKSELRSKKFRSQSPELFVNNISPYKLIVEEIDHYVSTNKKFLIDSHNTRFIIKNVGELPEKDFAETLENLIDRAFNHCLKEGRHPSKFGIIMNGEGLDYPIYIPCRSRDQNSVNVILNEIDKLEIRLYFVCII
jgi:hypothetical protein